MFYSGFCVGMVIGAVLVIFTVGLMMAAKGGDGA